MADIVQICTGRATTRVPTHPHIHSRPYYTTVRTVSANSGVK